MLISESKIGYTPWDAALLIIHMINIIQLMRIWKVFKMNVLYIGMRIYVIGNISQFRVKYLFPVSFSEIIGIENTTYNVSKIKNP